MWSPKGSYYVIGSNLQNLKPNMPPKRNQEEGNSGSNKRQKTDEVTINEIWDQIVAELNEDGEYTNNLLSNYA